MTTDLETQLTGTLKTFLDGEIQAEIERLLPLAGKAIPGLPGMLVGAVLANPEVDAAIAKYAGAGLEELLHLAAVGIGELRDLITRLIHDKLPQGIGDMLGRISTGARREMAMLKSSQIDQAVAAERLLLQSIANGKLDPSVLPALERMLGLAG
jgi:hypothetical protein